MIHFRDATAADFNLAFEIKKASIKPYIEIIWGWDEHIQLDFHARDFAPEQTQILVDEQGNDVGLLVVTDDEKTIHINNLLIVNRAQGKGIGTFVLSKFITRAKLSGKSIKLQVFKINPRAKALYEKLGFKTAGQTEFHTQMEFKWP